MPKLVEIRDPKHGLRVGRVVHEIEPFLVLSPESVLKWYNIPSMTQYFDENQQKRGRLPMQPGDLESHQERLLNLFTVSDQRRYVVELDSIRHPGQVSLTVLNEEALRSKFARLIKIQP